MSPQTAEPDSIRMQATSWRGKLSCFLSPFLEGRSTGESYFRRLLPLFYVAVCLPTILFLIFFRQPLGNPDELAHVARAYQISKGVLLTERVVPGERPRGLVDEAWLQLGSEVNKRRFESLETALPRFQEYGWSGTERWRGFNSSVYFPAAYIPQAIGLKVAQQLDLRLVQTLQLASMLNAAICLLIIGLAVYVAPEGKYFIACVGALPMSLHQLASTSPDGILIAASLLMFSLTITAVVKSKVSLPALLGVVAIGSITAATKLPYLAPALAALVALWWVEPRFNKVNIRYFIAGAAMICVPVLWTKISNASVVKYHLSTQVDPGAQIAFLLSQPLKIPNIAFSTLQAEWDSYLTQLIGVLGWLDAPLPRAAYFILGLGLIAVLVMDSVSVQPLLRWIFLTGVAASVSLIFLSLYLMWTPVASPGPIEGVQGRYFLPILPFLLFLAPRRKRLTTDNLKFSVFIIFGLFSSFTTVATILKRYYS